MGWFEDFYGFATNPLGAFVGSDTATANGILSPWTPREQWGALEPLFQRQIGSDVGSVPAILNPAVASPDAPNLLAAALQETGQDAKDAAEAAVKFTLDLGLGALNEFWEKVQGPLLIAGVGLAAALIVPPLLRD